jgi:hypothetical protein
LARIRRIELRIPGRRPDVRMAEEKLRQAQVMVGALELRRCRVPTAMHVHPPRRPLRHEAGALEAAVPPQMSEFPGRLSIVPPPRQVRISDLFALDREDVFRINEIDTHPAGVLAVEKPVILLPLGFEVESAEREPETIVRERDRVDASGLRVDGQ